MIDNGAGLISVPLDKWPEWNNLIAKYYMTNDMSKLKHWTYENGIQGVELHNRRAPQLKQKLNHKKRER